MALSPKEITLDQVYLKEGYFLVRQEQVKQVGKLIVPDSVKSIASLDEVIKSNSKEVFVGDYIASDQQGISCFEIGKDCWYMLMTIDDVAFIVKQ